MAKTTSLYVTQTIKCPNKQITNSDGTTALQLAIGASNYSVGTDQGVLKSLMFTSTDTSNRFVQLILNDGTNDRVVGTVPVPALSGTDGTVAAVDGLSSSWLPGLVVDQNDKLILPLGASYVLKIKAVSTLTSGKVIDCFAVVEEY